MHHFGSPTTRHLPGTMMEPTAEHRLYQRTPSELAYTLPPRAQVIEQDDTGWTEEWKKKLYEEEGLQPEVGRRSGRACTDTGNASLNSTRLDWRRRRTVRNRLSRPSFASRPHPVLGHRARLTPTGASPICPENWCFQLRDTCARSTVGGIYYGQ